MKEVNGHTNGHGVLKSTSEPAVTVVKSVETDRSRWQAEFDKSLSDDRPSSAASDGDYGFNEDLLCSHGTMKEKRRFYFSLALLRHLSYLNNSSIYVCLRAVHQGSWVLMRALASLSNLPFGISFTNISPRRGSSGQPTCLVNFAR